MAVIVPVRYERMAELRKAVRRTGTRGNGIIYTDAYGGCSRFAKDVIHAMELLFWHMISIKKIAKNLDKNVGVIVVFLCEEW